MRNRQNWEPRGESLSLINSVIKVINDDDYRDEWPLTVRQIYYALVGQLVIENKISIYKRLVRIIAAGRLAGLIPWEAVFDSVRDTLGGSGGWRNANEFVEADLDNFLRGYQMDLSSTQPLALEVWVEKDALARIAASVCEPYFIPTVIARGYSSVSYIHDLSERIEVNAIRGRCTKILYFGDLDPSGINMLPAMFQTLHQEMGVDEEDVSYERCALNVEQVRRFRLPQSPDALKDDEWQRTRGDPKKKKGDPRAEAYKAEYGKIAVELDAFRPKQFRQVVKDSIDRYFDHAALDKAKKQQEVDRERIEELREKATAFLQKLRKQWH